MGMHNFLSPRMHLSVSRHTCSVLTLLHSFFLSRLDVEPKLSLVALDASGSIGGNAE